MKHNRWSCEKQEGLCHGADVFHVPVVQKAVYKEFLCLGITTGSLLPHRTQNLRARVKVCQLF